MPTRPRTATMERPPHPMPTDPPAGPMSAPLSTLVRRAPVTLPPTRSIHAAAQCMHAQRVSSVLIEQDGLLFGLVTDRDLRNRVLATGLDPLRPVMDIATLAPLTLEAHATVFDALLLMARHNIHHVPLLDGQRIAGLVTASDLTERSSSSAVYLVGDLHKQTSVEGLRQACLNIRDLQRNLALTQASAYDTGHMVTAITDALTVRLLQLGERQFGTPPVEYVWVAAGSQARSEQTVRSDQDNCMVIDDAYDVAQHGEYFRSLSRFVCDGLDVCGYIYCPGEMMAVTDEWRQPRRQWADYFERWTSQPEPRALMLTSVFFDLRAVHGQTALLDGLRAEVLERTCGNSLFLAHMVGNALSHRPPLGLLRRFLTARSGEHRGTLDLKHGGTVPIIDLARVYALAGGDDAVNTHDRLIRAAGRGAISAGSAHDLRDALEFLSTLRIRHQAQQIEQGRPPDNHLDPGEISNFERTQLKDAFAVVRTLQKVLGQRFQSGRF